MLHIKSTQNRNQVEYFCIEDLVPQDHLLRLIDRYIDFRFIYDLVREKYSEDGRPSLDPVVLIKLPLLQYLFGIRSMRQTIKEIEVNLAYRWFLGLGLHDAVPHFGTFSKNYQRRFEGSDLFEQIFEQILAQCFAAGYVHTNNIFVDATHVKACANNHKKLKVTIPKTAKYYEKELKKEINQDREAHGKKPFDEDDDDQGSPGAAPTKTKEMTQSTTDPESGRFRKGEHKEVFAYCIQTACDENGWILTYSVHKGNEHDSATFPTLYNQIKPFTPKTIIADAAYKTPYILKQLIDDGIDPLLPYVRPKTGDGLFYKSAYVYDEYYDAYLCPADQMLTYSTTNREGYREYKSKGHICQNCQYLSQCTRSKNHTKVITQSIFYDYQEKAEDIRFKIGNRELYKKRKETIERIFGTAKEYHGFRYTNMIGLAKMKMKAGLTYAALNMKKLAKMLSAKEKTSLGMP